MRKFHYSIFLLVYIMTLILVPQNLKAQVPACDSNSLSTEESIRCWKNQANLAEESGDIEKSIACLLKAKKHAEAIGNTSEQSDILDDLVYLLTQIGKHDDALRFGYYLIELSENRNDSNQLVRAQVNVGRLQYQASNYPSAISHYQEALAYITPELQYEKGVTLLNLGVVYRDIGSFEKAMNSFHESIITFEGIGQMKEKAAALNALGILHQRLGNYKLSNKYHRMALTVRRKLDHQYGMAGSLHNLGKNYQEMGIPDSATYYLNQALNIKLTLNNPVYEASTYNILGKVHFDLNQIDSSLYYHRKAFLIRSEENNLPGKMHSANSLAALYLELNKYSLADSLLYLSKELGRMSGDFNHLAVTYNLLAVRYEKSNRDSLNKYLHLLISTKDSIYQIDKNRALIELDNRFEIDQKEREIGWLKENEILQSNQLKIRGIAAIVISCLLLLVVFILIKQISLTRKIKKLSKELSHRTKNHLQLLSAIFELHGNRMESPAAKDFVTSAQARLDAVNLIHQQLQINRESNLIELDTYLKALIQNLKHAFSDSVKMNLELAPITVHNSIALNLGLITSELITNSLKYVAHDQLIITIKLTDGKNVISLDIKDNGPGFDWKNHDKSMGLELVQIQMKQLKGTISYSNENGSSFKLRVPKSK